MASKLKNYIETKSEEDADIIVINSCTVTNAADISLKQYINRVSKLNIPIYLSGCKVPVSSDEELKSYGISGAFDAGSKERIDELLKKKGFFIERGGISTVDNSIVERFEGRSRAFVKVQEGCDFSCSYCIIPQTRGRARSRNESLILEQVRVLAKNGYEEVILTGTNVGSYGEDTGSDLGILIEKIGEIEGIKRVRVGSIEPSQVKKLERVLKAPYFAKHLHIALQHTSDKMLEVMNRKNRFKSDAELLDRLSREGFALGTDFLVGHPGESEEIWEEMRERVKLLPLTHAHLFIYSPRKNTPSSRLKIDVPNVVAKKRLKELSFLIKTKNLEFRSKKPELQVLCEKGRDGVYGGYDQFFNKIEIKSAKNLEKKWLTLTNYEVGNEKNFATL